MKLYALLPSPNTIKVIAIANHLGVDLEVIPVDIKAGAHQTPEFVKMNPNSLTPVLEDGDFHLWESVAILQYLALKHREAGLIPQDAQGQADMARWIGWCTNHWGPAIRPYMVERLVKPMMRGEAGDEEVVAKAEPEFMRFAKVLNDQLANRTYLLGDHLSVADFVMGATFVYAGPARYPLENFPNIQGYIKRLMDTPAWQKAMPKMPAAAK